MTIIIIEHDKRIYSQDYNSIIHIIYRARSFKNKMESNRNKDKYLLGRMDTISIFQGHYSVCKGVKRIQVSAEVASEDIDLIYNAIMAVCSLVFVKYKCSSFPSLTHIYKL